MSAQARMAFAAFAPAVIHSGVRMSLQPRNAPGGLMELPRPAQPRDLGGRAKRQEADRPPARP
jgi:hypothetical protein